MLPDALDVLRKIRLAAVDLDSYAYSHGTALDIHKAYDAIIRIRDLAHQMPEVADDIDYDFARYLADFGTAANKVSQALRLGNYDQALADIRKAAKVLFEDRLVSLYRRTGNVVLAVPA